MAGTVPADSLTILSFAFCRDLTLLWWGFSWGRCTSLMKYQVLFTALHEVAQSSSSVRVIDL